MPKKIKKERSRSKNKNPSPKQKSPSSSKNKPKIKKFQTEKSKDKKSQNKNETPSPLNESPKEQIKTTSSDLKIDINKQWQTHYDPHYSRNFYYNPFTNESVWELPPNASLSTYETSKNPENSQNESKTNFEIKNDETTNKKTQKKTIQSSYQEIESIPES